MSVTKAPYFVYKFIHNFSISNHQSNSKIQSSPQQPINKITYSILQILHHKMELSLSVQRLVPFLVVALVLPVYGQINSPCTPTMLTTFTPCMNFLTNSSGSGTSPSSDCCGSLRNLTGNSLDCACLIVTASVPFRVPINRTLAISLPRACNMPSVPVQCKGIISFT